MTVEHVPQEKYQDSQPFSQPGSPHQGTDTLRPLHKGLLLFSLFSGLKQGLLNLKGR
jgi:hypothetical protein